MRYDVAVVGGGHAGIEAALAARRLGCRVLLITALFRRVGEMSCNPAIGGIAKGTLVREIDALGGAMAESADATGIQFRMLNRRKGPAVWGPRKQADSAEYAYRQQRQLRSNGVTVLEDEVVALVGPTERPGGVFCRTAGEIRSDAIVIAAGTFLGGMLFRGRERWKGGRRGDISADSLDEDLRSRMFHVKRFKTGTSPRVVRSSVDCSVLSVQEEDSGAFRFSFRDSEFCELTEKCYTVRSTSRTIDAAREGMKESPLLSGSIIGKGPRYCPSFEDKVIRFPDRKSHLIHVEPVGLRSRLLYLNGLSTSLPRRAQLRMVRSLPGFSHAEIAAFGYAVEYSCIDFSEIDPSLRLNRTENVFAAGQILGTSGYEEAAALGLLAGANAARLVKSLKPCIPCRTESYLGVMVDDIVCRGMEEPYRLFSSRAENRLHIRQDNALFRMMPFAQALGTARMEDEKRWTKQTEEKKRIEKALSSSRIEGTRAIDLCRRPGVDAEEMIEYLPELGVYGKELVSVVILEEKYRGYIARNVRRTLSAKRLNSTSLSSIESFMGIEQLNWEAREILEKARPESVGEASKLAGIRPSDVEGLLIFLGRRRST